MGEPHYDVLLIGAGPAGYVGALRAAQLGLKVALIEAKRRGGVCLNWGCIPTKSLLQSADVYRTARNAETFGIHCAEIDFDVKKMVHRSRAVIKQLRNGIAHLLRKNNVSVLDGRGRLLGEQRVGISHSEARETFVSASHIVLASGARPRTLAGIQPDHKKIWTSRDALTPEAIPESLLVIGSGAIGMEFASFYSTFGSKVTVVEILDQILPAEDATVAGAAQKQFERQGIRFLLRSRVTALRPDGAGVTVDIDHNGQSLSLPADRVILCVGVVPNVDGLGIEIAGVGLDETGFVQIDNRCRTTAAGIYAVGDVAGGPCLAHKASHEAIHCIDHIAGCGTAEGFDRTAVPGCVYSHPQIARVGLSERQAIAAGHDIRVGMFPAKGNGKALILDETEGLVKTVFDACSGELLGAHIVGPDASEMIQGFVVARQLETTELDLMKTVFPHPTLSEMLPEAVLSAYGRGLHS